MGVRVSVTFDGIDNVLSNLDTIGAAAEDNIVAIVDELSTDTESAWKEATPVGKTGRLQGDEKAVPSGLEFTLESPTYYYLFRDEGHWSPRGWNTKHGYREAKRRSFVKGAFMTDKAIEFVEGTIEERLSHFLDEV